MAERLGWQYKRVRGDHLIYSLEGNPLNLSIPNHRELREGTLRTLISAMDITVDEFLTRARK